MGLKLARHLNRLTSLQVKNLSQPGRHADGGGLYLHISKNGARRWIYRFTRARRVREMGLGSGATVPLATARERAAQARAIVAAGGDPIEDRKRNAAVPSFGEAADAFLKAKEGEWRNSKHRAQWHMTLTRYCQAIRNVPVDQVDLDDVLRVLQPIWDRVPETANRLRGRIERVLDAAKAKGWRTGENPARWKGNLESWLARPKRLTRGHHKSMPYVSVPTFVAKLRTTNSISARALEFAILTAARTSEVRDAIWDEIDLERAVWTIPGARMKSGRQHRVPLCPRCLEILGEMAETRKSGHVFPGQRLTGPLSQQALTMALRRAGHGDVTVHGFRSSFRDWVGEETDFPREIAEAALAHVVGDATERAYRRRDGLERRRKLMEAWSAYSLSGSDKTTTGEAGPAS